MSENPRILVIDASYYKEISAELYKGAKQVLDVAGIRHDYVSVPGVLEIPAAVSIAVALGLSIDMEIDDEQLPEEEQVIASYDGYVVLGCVIRGETTHYDIVAGESARALMDLTTEYGLALGNGIQTVENEEQAWARARVSDKNKGGAAAETVLAMINMRMGLGEMVMRSALGQISQ